MPYSRQKEKEMLRKLIDVVVQVYLSEDKGHSYDFYGIIRKVEGPLIYLSTVKTYHGGWGSHGDMIINTNAANFTYLNIVSNPEIIERVRE